MNKTTFFKIALFSLLLGVGGCCIPYRVDYEEVPSWVYNPPSDTENVYVIGSAVPTSGVSLDRTVQLARQRAIKSLSQVLSYRVYSKMTERKARDFRTRGGVQQLTTKSKVHAQQEAMWYDRNGLTGQPQVFVLIRIPLKVAKVD